MALPGGVGGEGDAHVRGEGLESADLDDLDSGRLGLGMNVARGASDERHLAREIDVMGAAGDARVDDRAPVCGVWADEVQHDLGALGHRLERVGVGHVSCDRRRALDADVGER